MYHSHWIVTPPCGASGEGRPLHCSDKHILPTEGMRATCPRPRYSRQRHLAYKRPGRPRCAVCWLKLCPETEFLGRIQMYHVAAREIHHQPLLSSRPRVLKPYACHLDDYTAIMNYSKSWIQIEMIAAYTEIDLYDHLWCLISFPIRFLTINFSVICISFRLSHVIRRNCLSPRYKPLYKTLSRNPGISVKGKELFQWLFPKLSLRNESLILPPGLWERDQLCSSHELPWSLSCVRDHLCQECDHKTQWQIF